MESSAAQDLSSTPCKQAVTMDQDVVTEGSSSSSGSSCGWCLQLIWTVTLFCAMLAIGCALAMLGPTLEDLKNHFDVDLTAAGALFTFRAIGYFVGALTCGMLLEWTPNKAVVFLIPLVCACGGSLVIPHITSYICAGFLFSFQGMSMGMLDTGGNVIMLAIWRGSKFLNGVLHGLHFMFGLGALFGPLLVNAFRAYGYEGSSAWSGTGIALVPCCLGFLVLCFQAQPKLVKEEEGAASPWNRPVLLSAAFLFVYVGSEVTYGGFISVFLENYAGILNTSATGMASLYWGMLSLGRLVATAISSYINHTKYLVVNLFAAIAAMAVLTAVATEPTHLAMGGLGWWFGVVIPTGIVGLAFAPLFPGAMLVAEELLGGAMSGRAASLIVTAAASGEALFPLGTGLVIPMQPRAFSWIMLALVCAMLVIFLINTSSLLFMRKASRHHEKASKKKGAENTREGASKLDNDVMV